MIALSVAKLKMFSLESEIFRWIKPKKEEKTFLCLCDHMVLHNITSSSSFFSISLWFSRFFRSYFELKEFNKTIIPFVLVGYATGYSQLGATHLVGYLPSHIQRALME